MRRAICRWALLLTWMGVVLTMGSSTALPMQEGEPLRWLLRKGIHVAEYALLGFLFYQILTSDGRRYSPKHALLAALLAVGVGGLDEWRQSFIPGRYGSLLDVGIDALGAGIGQLLSLGRPGRSLSWLNPTP